MQHLMRQFVVDIKEYGGSMGIDIDFIARGMNYRYKSLAEVA